MDAPLVQRFNKIHHSLGEHWDDATEHFPQNQMIVLALAGSQNYELDTPNSDVDSKLLVLPSFEDLVRNKQSVSTTFIRENNEHIDFKDIRLYFETFRKQNLNFMEILFTDFFYLNLNYQDEWLELVKNRESIARMNPVRAVRSMAGLAERKFKNMEHITPANKLFIEKYGYVPKELHHLFRIGYFLTAYINDVPYIECMIPDTIQHNELMDMKLGKYNQETAKYLAQAELEYINGMADIFCSKYPEEEDQKMRKLLDDVCYEIMRKGLRDQLMQKE